MREALESHGGTVEKFIGDAVEAVFGVPVAHEDDALRAVRSAWEMRERVAVLNEELERRFDVRIGVRIGVMSGEVVAGDSSSRQTIVTGDAVNTAARLEQAAGSGEVLLGEPTYRLVRDAVQVEPVEPVAAKGKAQPVPAYRLVGVSGRPRGRGAGVGSLFFGREPELDELLRAWHAVSATGGCRCVTVVGEPGVGKSRLARELVERAGAETVLTGRCLSYGDGITWWPLAEVVREAAGISDEHGSADARSRLDALVAADGEAAAVAVAIARAIGLEPGAASVEEVQWAFRRLLAILSRPRAILVVDDLQWAEAPFAELVDSLPKSIRDAPLLVVCLARPELLERGAAPPNLLRLEPLKRAAAETQAARLITEAGLSADLAERVSRTAGGNPFFAEEIVAMLRDDPLASMPATVHQLLGDRLDRLQAAERGTLECAAIEGEVFHRGAVTALAGRGVSDDLQRLSERDFVRPARAQFVDERAFRFRHLLVRDAVYGATTKRLRATLHARFAEWLTGMAGTRLAEVEEIVGYHFEQAQRYLSELGPGGPRFGVRAAGHLAAAGRRAAERGEATVAASLLGRAADLLDRDDPARLELVLDRSIALEKAGDSAVADPGLLEVAADADRLGRPALRVKAALERDFARLRAADQGLETLAFAQRAEAAASELGRLGDVGGEARALTLATAGWTQAGRGLRAEETGRRALRLADAAGRDRDRADTLEWLSLALSDGPAPLAEFQEIVDELVRRGRESRSFEWLACLSEAEVLGPRGEVDLARDRVRHGRSVALELGLEVNAACASMQLAHAELLGGEVLESEQELRAAAADLERLGALNPLASVAAYLGLVLQTQGEHEEAETWAARAQELAAADDAEVAIFAAATHARAAVARGDAERAVESGQQALAAAEGVERVLLRTEALTACADALLCVGRHDEALAHLETALRLYERKGYVVAAKRTRRRLEELSR
jgi:tetratricopeptide (TPR) repeat protein